MRQVSFIEQWILDAEEEAARKSLAQGIQQGALEAYRDSVTFLLEDKFGIVQASVLNRLDKIYRVESLKSLIRQAPKVSTQAEFLDLINRAIE